MASIGAGGRWYIGGVLFVDGYALMSLAIELES